MMAKLIYSAIMSHDGYIEDETGTFSWAAPNDEVHAFVNERERDTGTYLYGRRMYDTMAVWETDPALVAYSPITRDYAHIWQAAKKIVYSTTLATVSTARTRIERHFDPAAVRRMVAAAARDVSIGGPALAAHAFEAGLVDECRLYVVPVIVGGGKRCLPRDIRLQLELMEEHRFTGGIVYLRYRTKA
jgi:dihydrofolate reductase